MGKSNKDKASGRDYKREAAWEDSPKEVKDREQRNNARRKLAKAGKVSKGDNRDVDHIKGLNGGNADSNLRVLSEHDNRAYKRTSKSKQIRKKTQGY